MNLDTLKGAKIGVALTGSFCTFSNMFSQIGRLVELGADVTCIFSDHAQTIDTRFGRAQDFMERARELTGKPIITTIRDAEPLGPHNFLDVLLIAPCTGNTIAKLANGISDTPALMAAKGHLRNGKPLVISLSTNDALGMNLKNIGILVNTKSIYFVPFGQDNYEAKPNSMISHVELIPQTVCLAMEGKQLHPIIRSPYEASHS